MKASPEKLPLFSDNSFCLAKKHLTKNIFEKLKNRKTANGFSLYDAVYSGIENLDSDIGFYAGDVQSYDLFKDLVEPIIFEYHKVPTNIVHKPDFSFATLENPDPDKKFIQSTRIRVARNIDEFAFPPSIKPDERIKVEKEIKEALNKLDSDLTGKYFSFSNISKETYSELLQKKLIFKKGDRFQAAAGINSDFPQGRAVFLSMNEKFIVWINEEDHMRIISMEKSADIASVFNRLSRAVASLNEELKFAKSHKFGSLTSCPTNIGTAMRASVHIKLTRLHKNKNMLEEIIKKHHLQLRGTAGEKTKIANQVYDISNRQRLGITEKECIKSLYDGCKEIINIENRI